jgi:sulfite reductase (NADPH) hemoprotein beta-component
VQDHISRRLDLYNLQLGGDYEGKRLNKIYKENLDEKQILSELDEVFAQFRKERKNGEKFGDYSFRKFFNNQPA